ncbi:Stromal interaction molecule [Orchesella cincta]|uniref:Stromal interaction molecule n=1 Tax=Orchesella cincta TaxID=48709 RepID=A0A1D2MKT1_ORCCI|nr:Stromal interaction molecule [Orchesella cincta]
MSFLREELKYDRDYEKRQENFHRNNDNQVSVKELWEIWVKSEVHNWTVDHTAEWISLFVGLPQYQEKFIQLAINGTFLPRLAVNHQNFLTTNLGIKDVITRQKLTLKAQDVVLFGPPKDNTNHTKDAVLTTLLVVAVTVCYLVYCRYKSSQRDLSRMSKDMEALIKAEETLKDLQKEMELAKVDQERDKQAVSHRVSADDEDELHKLRDEVIVLRNELQRAEVELQDKCWVPPPALTHWLQYTYELESKTHSKKRQAAEKQLKQAKEACDKLKKKRSSLMGAFVATHARSIDDVDKAILEARGALTEVTQELQERMHRWKQIEMLIKSPIVNNPGIQSLEILLQNRGRSHPYLGAGSIMSNSQDDIDDDASSIYCPSAVSGPITNVHTPIARSKSVQSMLSLRERGLIRESSSKDSSNGEDDIVGDASEMMSAKDRRVTFRAAADRRTGQMRSYQGRQGGPQYEPMEFEEARNRKPISASRLESSKSSEEEPEGTKLPEEEPDLIKVPNVNTNVQLSNTNTSTRWEASQSSTKTTSDLTTQTSEPNILLLNNKTPEKSLTVEASCTQPGKSSFFKSISKLMRLPSDGLTLKKTKKTSKDSCQNENKQILNGSGTVAATKNNLITEKNLLPPYTEDEDGAASKSFSLRMKSHKKSTSKFFSSLRRKSNSGLTAS